PDHSFGIEQLKPADLDLERLRLDLEEEPDALADVVAQRGPLLIANFVGISLDVEDSISVHLLHKTVATAGERPVLAPRGREGPHQDNHGQSDDPNPDSLHGVVSFLNPPFRSP